MGRICDAEDLVKDDFHSIKPTCVSYVSILACEEMKSDWIGIRVIANMESN